MTAIVGLIDTDTGTVYLGGDHGATDSRGVSELRSDSKVWRDGQYVFGVSNSFRLADIMRYVFDPPPFNLNKKPTDPLPFMVKTFVPALREALDEAGLEAPAEEKNENPLPGQILVGLGTDLFEIEADYQVGRSMDRFRAIGSGDLICLGVLQVLVHQHTPMSPEDMIFTALGTAEYFVTTVHAPFTIVNNGRT
jgi:hypothetical protein